MVNSYKYGFEKSSIYLAPDIRSILLTYQVPKLRAGIRKGHQEHVCPTEV